MRFAWDHLRSTALRRVYTRFVYDSQSFRRRLAHLVRSDQFDLVHIDSLDLAQYLPVCRDLPVVCVHHDVESNLLRRRADIDNAWWRKVYFRYQASLMDSVERQNCERVALNVAVSEQDRQRITAIAPRSRVAVVPNGVDTDEFHTADDPGTGLAYVGGTSPFPNRDALNFYCEDILPRLREANFNGPMRWIGNASAEEQRSYRERYGMELTGYVDDVRPHMAAAACHIVPLRTGGGTRLKILNAWAMGKPVVSTSVGCEGLAAEDGVNILIRDTPTAFADAVVEVLGNARVARELGARGRETAERLYSWEAIARPMLDTYLTLASGYTQTSVISDSALHQQAHA
jgi:glycosyltransferase involved in cell wall biosynthesis